MFVTRVSKTINQYLIRVFDQSRLRYIFFLFPVYQLLAALGITAIVLSFEAASTALYFASLGLVLVIFIGIPIFASWYLSCLLFCMGFFGFLAWLGLPFMSWVTRQLEHAVNWFRPV